MDDFVTTDAISMLSTDADDMVSESTPLTAAPKAALIPWDNPFNIMTKESSDEAVFVMQCVLLPILTVWGVVGNVLSLIVLLHKKLRSSTGVILVGLALADLLSLLSNMIRKSTGIIGEFDMNFADKYKAMMFGPIFYLKTSFDRISVWLVVLISIERFLAVSFPLKIKIWVSKARMFIAVVTIYILTLASLSPIAAQYTTGTLHNPRTNSTTYFIKPSQFYFNNIDFLKIHNEIFGIAVFRYIPVILVILFNSVIMVSLQRRAKWRSKKSSLKSKDEAQAKITRMLLIVSLVCLICTTPGAIFILYSQIDPDFVFMGKYHNFFLVISDMCMLLEVINSSANFVIYMLCNEQFYQVYKKMFCSWIKKARPSKPNKELTKSAYTEDKKTVETNIQVTCSSGEENSAFAPDENSHGTETEDRKL
ncbi:hypothetical protein FSP39_021445 [Pinctada imbricata]|uniref:G-protein coupled receptors family 1 profile domain-containing protein n=1 Tax=Pinctada imbricata TaxID=66713 RepID=A0AA88YJ39_PINIB|nr:hypothetical protein FSP39_021445 [Pinctada imbricata]